jgi:hypothetical protein
MKKYIKVLSLLFFISFFLQIIFIKHVNAVELQNNIVLLMDVSGSMQQTDPRRLSMVAASMLIDSIDENTKVNIVTFGDKANAYYSIESNPSKEALKNELLNIKFNNNYTDLKEGIKEALVELSKVQGNKDIIVLSDGKEDPKGGLSKEYTDEFSTLIEKTHLDGIKVNCIALSQKADKDVLEDISFKTEGEYYYSSTSSELFNVFSSLLGNINNFYTVNEYEIEDQSSREVKLSSYVQEVLIKIAAIDNNIPLVDVMQNNKQLLVSKLGEGYKIYNFKNTEDNVITISPKDKGKYSVIVQIKSKAKINVNSIDNSFSIPNDVPLNIDMSLETDKDIIGLHMDKFEGNIREGIKKTSNGFSFTFNKAKSGQYKILITTYDGKERIIAVENLNINVTDYPPFYYRDQIPREMIIGKPYKIELNQVNGNKVINPSGEIIVDYGDKYEKFPLKLVDNTLVSEITLNKLQEVRLTTCINGVSNNESFSYFLPYFKINAIKEPLTKPGYFYQAFKIPIYIILMIIVVIFIFILFGRYQYKRLGNFSITKELTYKLSLMGTNYFLAVTLSPIKNIKYLNLKGNSIEVEDEGINEIGYIMLNLPSGNKVVQGIKYFVLKDKAFYEEYYPSMRQQVYREDDEIYTSFIIEGNFKSIIKVKREEITIYFS